jgi:hypothetical protein
MPTPPSLVVVPPSVVAPELDPDPDPDPELDPEPEPDPEPDPLPPELPPDELPAGPLPAWPPGVEHAASSTPNAHIPKVRIVMNAPLDGGECTRDAIQTGRAKLRSAPRAAIDPPRGPSAGGAASGS